MKKRTLFTVLLSLVILLALTGRGLAQSSASYNLGWNALTNGGGTRTSMVYVIRDSLGQLAVGASSSATLQIQSGFWNGTADSQILYLPLVIR
jgi:hypothetical protein